MKHKKVISNSEFELLLSEGVDSGVFKECCVSDLYVRQRILAVVEKSKILGLNVQCFRICANRVDAEICANGKVFVVGVGEF